jgi:hypothetical protein
MFENIFNTVMSMKGKTKDNINARMDIPLFSHYKTIKFIYDGSQVTKPKANFVLNKNA